MEGRCLDAIAPAELSSRVDEYLRAPRTNPSFECHWRAAGGGDVFVEITAVPGAQGNTLLIVSDRTDRWLLEATRRQAHQYEGLATLADGFAHEFNNVLAIIMGHASLLRDVADDRPRVIQIGDIIIEASRRGTGVVKQVALFAGQNAGEKARVDLHQAINQVLARRRWPATVTVQCDLRSPDPHLIGVGSHVEQCLDCLLDNALDALPHGGTITVATELASRLPRGHPGAPAPFLELTVGDTGCGMDRATQSRIFEPFFAGSSDPRKRGLGLAVVYGIVRSHHGFIEVDSATGAGTRIKIYFPSPHGQTVAPPHTAGAPPAAAAVNAGPQRRTVLMIEDEPDIGTLMTEIFRRNGISVLWARDAEEGLRLYRRHTAVIGAVFTDVGLPGMDGMELCRKLREITPTLPLVVASGYLRGESGAAPAGDPTIFLIKPYDHAEVVAKVSQLLSRIGVTEV